MHVTADTDAIENVTLVHCPPERVVRVDVPVKVYGEEVCPGIKAGARINWIKRTVPCVVPGSSIPTSFEIDVRCGPAVQPWREGGCVRQNSTMALAYWETVVVLRWLCAAAHVSFCLRRIGWEGAREAASGGVAWAGCCGIWGLEVARPSIACLGPVLGQPGQGCGCSGVAVCTWHSCQVSPG